MKVIKRIANELKKEENVDILFSQTFQNSIKSLIDEDRWIEWESIKREKSVIILQNYWRSLLAKRVAQKYRYFKIYSKLIFFW